MKLSNSLLFLTLLVSFCHAAPTQQQRSPKKDSQPAASVIPNVQPNGQPAVASSTKPSGTVSPASPKSTAPSAAPAAMMPATMKAPPVLLSQLTAKQAGGSVPSGPPPATSFSPKAVVLFKVANFIENIESAFFAESLLTLQNDPAFTNASTPDGRSISNITVQIAAQELVHIATVQGLLGLVNDTPVPPCTSVKAPSTVMEFLAKANIVTSVALGVIVTLLQDVSTSDPAVVTPLGSILSCESQQDAFFRMSGSNPPSASPFNTAVPYTFAYNIVRSFVDPSSCPQLLSFPILPSLNLTSPSEGTATAPATPPTSLTFTASDVPANTPLFIGFINQANPVVYSKVTVNNGIGTADIPAGLTGIVFLSLSAQNAAMSSEGLANATLAGPATILMS